MNDVKAAGRRRETSLYAAVKRHLETLGYEAKGEICGCDIVGIRPGEPPVVVITELKLSLSLELILQGVDRLAAADEVWLAVLATRRGRDRDRRAHKLCRMLGLACWRSTRRGKPSRCWPSRHPTVPDQMPNAAADWCWNTSAGRVTQLRAAHRVRPF